MTIHYSQGSASASFVELIGNATVLSGTQLTKDAGSIFSLQGKFPIECLPSALHESAHHYCFCMPVGHALSACFLEAVRTHLADDPSDERDDHLAEALIRYDIVTTALRPLAEGIALYAEFDASPGESRASISPPLSDAFELFGASLSESDGADKGRSVVKSMEIFLLEERLKGATIERRETLLSHALIDDKDGYLTGYWLVKNWRLHLLDRIGSVALFDTDFYLQFIANYIYGDLELANLIVNFGHYRVRNVAGLEDGQEDFMNAFLRHLQKRLRHLVSDLEQGDVDRMETAFASTVGYSFDSVQVPLPGHQQARLSDFSQAITTLGQRFGDVQPPELGVAMIHILNGRHWMAYASFETSVRLNEHNRFLLGEGEHEWNQEVPVLAGPVLRGSLKTGKASGVIELICDRTANSGHFRRLVWRDTELVAVFEDYEPSASAQTEGPSDDSLPKFSSARIRAIVNDMSQRVRADFNETIFGPVVAEDYAQQLAAIRGDIYGRHLALFVQKDGKPPTDQQLRQPLPAFCGNDTKALRVAAAHGFVNGGIVSISDQLLDQQQVDALLGCPVQLGFKRSSLLLFRI